MSVRQAPYPMKGNVEHGMIRHLSFIELGEVGSLVGVGDDARQRRLGPPWHDKGYPHSRHSMHLNKQ